VKRLLALPILIAVLTVVSFASVTVTTPTNGTTVQSPVNFVASATSYHKITGMVIYVDSKNVYSTNSSSLNTSIPMSSGQHAIVVEALNSQGRIYTDSLSLLVTSTPAAVQALQLTTTSLANGTVGSGYSAALQATGGISPYTWSLASGFLPSGLVLSTSGTISGTPSASGAYSFSVTVKDSESSPQAATSTIALTIVAAPLVSVTVAPTSTSVKLGTTQQFTATLSGTTNTGTTWSVNGTVGGNSTYGTITSAGLYTAPATVPSGAVSVTTTSNADSTKSASAVVTITPVNSNSGSVSSPTFWPSPGTYSSAQVVTVASSTSGAVLCYTINGTTPTATTPGTCSNGMPLINGGTVTIPSGLTLKAIGTKSGVTNSAATSGAYSITGAGTTYYVATAANGGSDSNPGTVTAPWATINHAGTVATAGQTVEVEDGIYNQTVTLQSHSGTSSSLITFESMNKWGAQIEPTSTTGNSSYSVYLAGVSYVAWKNFYVTGTPTNDSVIKMFTGAPNNYVIGNNVNSSGGSSSCISGSGIEVADNYETVRGNYIWNIGLTRGTTRCNQQHGIYVTAGTGGWLQNNVIFEIWQGFAFHFNGNNLSNWTVTNNTVFNDGSTTNGDGGGFILDCEGGTCAGNIVNNNLFYGIQYYTLWEVNDGGTVGTNAYSNNLLYASAGTIMVNGNPVNSVTSHPEFTNYTGDQKGDYHLQSLSPAINAGTSVGAPSTDADGNPRSTSSEVIGAYVQ
jgi:hypothetical protein